MCGEGYSCFFTGLDYHCCPSVDDIEDIKSHGECPDYAFAFLDSYGKQIRCSSIGKQCPEVGRIH